MPANFDLAEMMGLADLAGAPPGDFGPDIYSGALDMRDAQNQHQQPWLKQDYTGTNPYDDGAHGGWLDASMMGTIDAMDTVQSAQAPANAGLQIPIEEEVDDEIEGDSDLYLAPHENEDEATQMYLDEEAELLDDSDDFQTSMLGEDDEAY